MTEETGRCSYQARHAKEPLAGTAPHAVFWVLVEQPGPWGRDALSQSHLVPEVGRALIDWAAAAPPEAPVRMGLIRRPGRHADSHSIQNRTVLVALSDPLVGNLRTFSVENPSDILSWDLPSLMSPSDSRSNATTAVLVCTNARRDECCALLGRPLAAELAQRRSTDSQVWETSHLGGHRFAPTFVDLPSGYLFGGPSASTRSVDACRGRSSLPPPAQTAELAVMKHLGWTHPAPLVVRGGGGSYSVTTPDQSTFQVSVAQRQLSPRPESCRKPSVPGTAWQATITR